MIRIAVCDDEEFYRKSLIQLIDANKPIEQIAISEFDSGPALIKAHQEVPFGIVFLDIEMPGQNGLEVANCLKTISDDLIIIFVSNHKQYVFDVFSVEAFRYLLKPITPEHLKNELFNAIEKYLSLHAVYTLQNNTHAVLRVAEIVYIEIQGHTLHIHALGPQTFTLKGKMDDEEQKLSPYGFIRCHKSYMVNPRAIREIDGMSLKLQNGIMLPIGKKKKAFVMTKFQEYIERYAI